MPKVKITIEVETREQAEKILEHVCEADDEILDFDFRTEVDYSELFLEKPVTLH